MKSLSSNRMTLVVVGIVAAAVVGSGSAKADFTFGEPTNLGPLVNTSDREGGPNISADGLTLYFNSQRPGGYGHHDLWVTTRATKDDPWQPPENLGPVVNSSASDGGAYISADGLRLYFHSERPDGLGNKDIWVTTRATQEDPWGEPVNLGPEINSPVKEAGITLSADELTLYFFSNRSGGYGEDDLWVTTRETIDGPWSEAINLGSAVNSAVYDRSPYISADGLTLFFSSYPGGYGGIDIWMSSRATTEDAWSPRANIGPEINTSDLEADPDISADGSFLFFKSMRPGGHGDRDIWQASIEPVVDLNVDGIVDSADMCIMVDYWGTNEPLCDIGPMPWGDGIVDVQDLIVLAEHLFEEVPPAESVE